MMNNKCRDLWIFQLNCSKDAKYFVCFLFFWCFLFCVNCWLSLCCFVAINLLFVCIAIAIQPIRIYTYTWVCKLFSFIRLKEHFLADFCQQSRLGVYVCVWNLVSRLYYTINGNWCCWVLLHFQNHDIYIHCGLCNNGNIQNT